MGQSRYGGPIADLTQEVDYPEELRLAGQPDLSDKWEKEYTNKNGKLWDHFSGSEKSRIFEIYKHDQYRQEEVEKITLSDKRLLLQIGENRFNNEYVFSVLINKHDVIERNLDNFRFSRGQS